MATNSLVRAVGIDAKPIMSFAELQKSASSMFVGIFEAMFKVRAAAAPRNAWSRARWAHADAPPRSLVASRTVQVKMRDIEREPKRVSDYVHNAQTVIDALARHILSMDLSHVTGEAICRGNRKAISNLVDIFTEIEEILRSSSSLNAARRSRSEERRSTGKGWASLCVVVAAHHGARTSPSQSPHAPPRPQVKARAAPRLAAVGGGSGAARPPSRRRAARLLAACEGAAAPRRRVPPLPGPPPWGGLVPAAAAARTALAPTAVRRGRVWQRWWRRRRRRLLARTLGALAVCRGGVRPGGAARRPPVAAA